MRFNYPDVIKLELGVEYNWSEKFSQSIATTGKGQNYQPHWYQGSSWNEFGAGGFANNFGNSLAGQSHPQEVEVVFSGGGGGVN